MLAGGNVGRLAHLPEREGLVLGVGGEIVEKHGGRAVHHGGAELEQARVEEGFIDDLGPDTGQVTDGNTNSWEHFWEMIKSKVSGQYSN